MEMDLQQLKELGYAEFMRLERARGEVASAIQSLNGIAAAIAAEESKSNTLTPKSMSEELETPAAEAPAEEATEAPVGAAEEKAE